VLTTTILATYSDPITKVIGGKPIVVATFPSAAAFNVVFSIGIGLSIAVIALSLAIKKGIFKKGNGANS
jgi:hypothetical protein